VSPAQQALGVLAAGAHPAETGQGRLGEGQGHEPVGGHEARALASRMASCHQVSDDQSVPGQETGAVGYKQAGRLVDRILHAAHLDTPVAITQEVEQRGCSAHGHLVEAERVHLARALIHPEDAHPASQLLEELHPVDAPSPRLGARLAREPGLDLRAKSLEGVAQRIELALPCFLLLGVGRGSGLRLRPEL
jgi:hypothetical protein